VAYDPAVASRSGSPLTRADLKAELKNYPTRKELRAETGKLRAETGKLGEETGKLRAEVEKLTAEIARCATKAELKAVESRLAAAIARLSIDMEGMRGTMATMATKDDMNRILTVLDGLAVDYKATWHKLVVHDHRLDALEQRCPPA